MAPTTKVKTLRYGNLGVGLQEFVDALGDDLHIINTLETLIIDLFDGSSSIPSTIPSVWHNFASLETFERPPFAVLLDADLTTPPRLFPPHPLPSTLRTLIPLPSPLRLSEPPSSSPADSQAANTSLADATAILLVTIKDLPNLEELAVDDVLHEGELEKECEARGIRLRSSVGA